MNEKHDVIIPLGSKSWNNRNIEIQIAVSSILKFCSSWVYRIIIVGEEPPSCIKDMVIHIPADDIYTHCKDANIIHKIRTAIDCMPDITDDFIVWSDDQFVTKETQWSDCQPRYVKIFDDNSISYFRLMANSRVWWQRLLKTLNNFPKPAKFWNPHIPSPMNTYKFLEMCDEYDYSTRDDITIFSLYYNFINEIGVETFDEYHCQRGETDWSDARWIGFFNSSMSNKNFMNKIYTLFPNIRR